MELKGKVAVITGGASGIGREVCRKLAEEQVRAVGVVDISDNVGSLCAEMNAGFGREVMIPFHGDTTDARFRERVFSELERRFGLVTLCVPAAGITRDRLSVKVRQKEGGFEPDIYSEEEFRRVIEINLVAPIYWAMRMIASVAMDRARKGLGRWTPEESMQSRTDFVRDVQGRFGGGPGDAGDGGRVPRCALRDDPPGLHGHGNGPGLG
jgi:3-oxoacyl-[acyl-carrier protein] reductase